LVVFHDKGLLIRFNSLLLDLNLSVTLMVLQLYILVANAGASDIRIDRTCAVSLSKEILPDITVGEIVEEQVKQPDQRVAKQAVIVKEHRSLPPAGDLLTRRLPAELVGDALQVRYAHHMLVVLNYQI
jgi:hypothetical protein